MGQVAHQVSVLLVEDEVLISMLVAETLSEHGFTVHEVATADEALRYIESGAAVDVLFTDVNLPGTIDGCQLAERVRARRPELPVVYASGRHDRHSVGRLVPRSVFVAKPYNPDDICTLLARVIDAPHQAEQ